MLSYLILIIAFFYISGETKVFFLLSLGSNVANKIIFNKFGGILGVGGILASQLEFLT